MALSLPLFAIFASCNLEDVLSVLINALNTGPFFDYYFSCPCILIFIYQIVLSHGCCFQVFPLFSEDVLFVTVNNTISSIQFCTRKEL